MKNTLNVFDINNKECLDILEEVAMERTECFTTKAKQLDPRNIFRYKKPEREDMRDMVQP